jgi:hypothetical protein
MFPRTYQNLTTTYVLFKDREPCDEEPNNNQSDDAGSESGDVNEDHNDQRKTEMSKKTIKTKIDASVKHRSPLQAQNNLLSEGNLNFSFFVVVQSFVNLCSL